MSRARAVLACGTAAAAAISVLALSSSPPLAAPWRALGPTNPNRRIEASLVLALQHRGQLARFLSPRAEGGLPAHGVRLTPGRFGARFGLSLRRIATISDALRQHGLSVIETYPQRTALRVAGSAAAFERAFGTELQNRGDSAGRRWFAPRVAPRVPDWLGAGVTGITGLDTRPVMVAADVPAGGLGPSTLARAYDIQPLRAAGIDGAGQTIAVVSYDSYRPSDLATFDSKFSIRGPQIRRELVSGGTHPGSQQQEVDLDLETIHGIAPGAQIVDYEAPPGIAGDADVINQIVADHRARVISTSWGVCDLLVPPAIRLAEQNALAAARAAGITIFAASGDQGAYDCQSADVSDQRPSVDWPAASDSVVAVGGTRLAVRADGSYLAEYGWEDVLQGDGSGGGLASVTPRPPWQRGPGVDNAQSDGHRQLPDVAGPADPTSGMVVFTRGRTAEIGGTSAAAPFWAGALALMREYAQRHGARDLGFIAPLLYRLAANPATADAFHKPIRGGNRRFSVTPAWNYVDGLGSPDVAVMARDLAALVGRR
jgi:kumamolisin